MDKDEIDIISQLFAKSYLTELSDEEKARLEQWTSQKSGRQGLGDKIGQAGFVSHELQALLKVDGEAGYRAFRLKQRRMRVWRYAKYAAVMLPLGFFLAWGFELLHSLPEPVEQVASVTPITHGVAKAELVLDDGTTYSLGDQTHEKRLKEKNVEISVKDGKLCYNKSEKAETVKYNTLVVPRGGEYVLVMSDNTVVHLNAESKLRYPVQFNKGKREVFLEGEAFFDVSKRSGLEFLVHTKQGCISVLGTSFNVRAYADEPAEATTLVTGKVKVHAQGEREMEMAPGEQCCLDDAGMLTKRQVDVYPYIAWKEGLFAFDKQPLEEVMGIIGRWYDIDVRFETEQVRKILISGKIQRFSDFRSVTDLLEMTGNLMFEVEGKRVAIRRKL